MTTHDHRTILVASLSRIPKDGRVLRQIASLRRQGHQVVAFGYGPTAPAAEPPLPDGVKLIDLETPRWKASDRLSAICATLAAKMTRGEQANLSLAELLPGVGALSTAIDRYLTQFHPGDTRPMRLIANDWTSLPAAVAAHAKHGISFHYDTHEFATEEHAHSLGWRLLFPEFIRRIEAIGLNRASSSSCPSEGIQDAMEAAYAPRAPIALVRNVPDAIPLQPRPIGRPIEVLYHGLFKPDRGLIDLARGVGNWPSQFRLRLRGRAPDSSFGAALQTIAAASGGRIVISDMVPLADVVSAANASDIGVFLPDVELAQNRHAFPNKLFEYLHAGLMVIAPAGTEMGQLVMARRAGLATETVPADLAKVLAALTPETIAAHKAAAAAAAADLCWEVEEKAFLTALALER